MFRRAMDYIRTWFGRFAMPMPSKAGVGADMIADGEMLGEWQHFFRCLCLHSVADTIPNYCVCAPYPLIPSANDHDVSSWRDSEMVGPSAVMVAIWNWSGPYYSVAFLLETWKM